MGADKGTFCPPIDILVLNPDGPVTEAETKALRKTAEDYLADHKHIRGILIDAQRFPGFEGISGLVGHIKFVAEVHNKVEKVALVTDTDVPPVAEFMAKHFLHQNIRHFPYADRDAALAWLGEH